MHAGAHGVMSGIVSRGAPSDNWDRADTLVEL